MLLSFEKFGNILILLIKHFYFWNCKKITQFTWYTHSHIFVLKLPARNSDNMTFVILAARNISSKPEMLIGFRYESMFTGCAVHEVENKTAPPVPQFHRYRAMLAWNQRCVRRVAGCSVRNCAIKVTWEWKCFSGRRPRGNHSSMGTSVQAISQPARPARPAGPHGPYSAPRGPALPARLGSLILQPAINCD